MTCTPDQIREAKILWESGALKKTSIATKVGIKPGSLYYFANKDGWQYGGKTQEAIAEQVAKEAAKDIVGAVHEKAKEYEQNAAPAVRLVETCLAKMPDADKETSELLERKIKAGKLALDTFSTHNQNIRKIYGLDLEQQKPKENEAWIQKLEESVKREQADNESNEPDLVN